MIVYQLARRDRFIESVEIYEFVKKKVKFKEVKGGFVIKDKKFLMHQIQGIPIASDDGEVEAPPQFAGLQPHEIMMQQRPQAMSMLPPQTPVQPLNVKPQMTESGVPMALHPQRFEVFDPDPLQMAKLQGRYKLTPGNKYPVFREWRDVGNVTHYLIKDDRNMEIQIGAEYFTVPGKGLIGGNFEADPLEQQLNRGLSFQGNFLEDRGVPYRGHQQQLQVDSDEIPANLLDMPDLSRVRGRI